MVNRLRQTVQSIKATPAEQRMDAGGPAPNLTKGLAGGLQSVAEILGPQADIAAMVEEARRAESSFSKGDYLDAAGSTGLAAIAPLMMATPGSVKSVREISEELIPAKPLGVGVDENLISGKAIKNYTSNDFNILDDLISQGKANAGTKKANKLLDAPVEEGANVGVRLNLNSKIEDTPENLKPMLQTLHKNSASGKALSYKPYATVVATDKKKVKFYVSPKGREDIATGNKAKYPAMSVNGAYDPNLKILPNDPDVVEVGFNPKAHHLFVDLNTGQAVKEADAATIIGDRVYAKGITYFKKSEAPKPKAKSQVRYKEKKKGGSVIEHNPYANYQPKAI
jgi:hypothetical protein